MKDEEFMREALKEAAIARDNQDWAVGCVITYNDEIVARGRNRVFSGKSRLLHAEIDAIQELQKKHFIKDFDPAIEFTMYTTLEPCPMCFGALLLTSIRTVISGTNLDNSGASASMEHLPGFFTQPRHKTTMTTGVLEAECEAMWLSGEPAKRLIQRGAVEVRLSNGNRGKRTYTSPTRHPSDSKNETNSSRQENFAISLRSLFSSNK